MAIGDTINRRKAYDHIGLVLKAFIDELGLSQNHVAMSIFVHPNRISDIIKGKRTITADTDLRLTKFFGLSAGYFLEWQTQIELKKEKLRLQDTLKQINKYKVR